MSWSEAIAEALEMARTHPNHRFYVAGYRCAYPVGRRSWLYVARCAGRVRK